MKRFRWPLQRLLDVTFQREQVLRAESSRLSGQIVSAHREIFRRQAVLRGVLADLSRRGLAERLDDQQVFMRYSRAEEAQLDRLREQLKGLQAQRSEKMAELTKAKGSRETLERLLAEALDRHEKQAIKEEQKDLDENSQVSFARGLLARRAGNLG